MRNIASLKQIRSVPKIQVADFDPTCGVTMGLLLRLMTGPTLVRVPHGRNKVILNLREPDSRK